MTITLTYNEAYQRCYNWTEFCDDLKINRYALVAGGGNIEITITEEKAKEHRIINP